MLIDCYIAQSLGSLQGQCPLVCSFMPGDIPREQTQAFLDAFARMPQRVLARMVLSGNATQSLK